MFELSKDVYIVHCIDTEGPLYESIDASFKRLKEIFGLELEPTNENLHKIQNKELDLNGAEDLVADAFAPKRINTLGTWDQIDRKLDELMSTQFRNQFLDSDGNGWVYNWFCLDHVGFTGDNPRHRDAGYGNIYRHYAMKLRQNHSENVDLLQFHYHALPFNGAYNYAGTAYVNSNNLFGILARRILDNHSFPAAYRAGMEAERPDAHWFLEQWIPFDYSCNSYFKENIERQPDLRDGRYGDWRRATKKWYPYHPSHDDYQVPGNCHRWITRCLSLDSRLIKLELEDVEQAFSQAQEGKPTILSFSSHDFRDLRPEVQYARELIQQVAAKYPYTQFHFCNAIDAMQKVENLSLNYSEIEITPEINKEKNNAFIHIKSNSDIFGTQPFFVFKTVTGDYRWDNLDYGEKAREWSYVFDDKTIGINAIEQIGVAVNSSGGMTEIVIYNVADGKKEHYYL